MNAQGISSSSEPSWEHAPSSLQVLRLVGERRILPVVDRVIPLDDIAEGHRLLEDQQHFGKIVLIP